MAFQGNGTCQKEKDKFINQHFNHHAAHDRKNFCINQRKIPKVLKHLDLVIEFNNFV